MKRVVLREGVTNSVDMFVGVLGHANMQQQVDLAHARLRMRVMDKLEAAKGAPYIDLEDQDHAMLKQVLETATFAIIRRDVLEICDDVINAKDPPNEVATG